MTKEVVFRLKSLKGILVVGEKNIFSELRKSFDIAQKLTQFYQKCLRWIIKKKN